MNAQGTKLKKRINPAATFLFYVVAVAFLVIFGFPFVFVLITSFKDQAGYMKDFWAFPTSLYFENFKIVLQPYFLRYFLNSIFLSLTSVTLTILAGSLAGFVLATEKFKLREPLLILFLVGMMIPIHTTLIPVYTLTNSLGLGDKTYGLIGPYASFALPVTIYILTSFFRDVPNSIRESATIDGASPLRIYWNIMMPLSRPAIATVGIYDFLHTWNEFIYSLTLINSTNQKTLPVGLREFYGAETINIPAIMAAILIASLPVMLFYFFAQEQVINGLSSGAVKG